MTARHPRESQRCPNCGLIEAAGSYCTRCLYRTGPGHRVSRRKGGKGNA